MCFTRELLIWLRRIDDKYTRAVSQDVVNKEQKDGNEWNQHGEK